MTRRRIRRRPATPNLKSQSDFTADPNSPPETPTTSPPVNRKTSLKPRRQPDFHDYFQTLEADPNIKPVGGGHQFSYQPSLGPEQLSPRSRSSHSSEAVDDSSDEDDDSGSPSIRSLPNEPAPAVSRVLADSDADMSESSSSSDDDESDTDSEFDSDKSGASEEAETSHLTTTTTATCNFVLEDVDPMDSDCEGLDVLHPTEIESNRSRSRSRHKELDKDMMKDLKNLEMRDPRHFNRSSETSDNEHPDYDDDEKAFYRKREQRRKFRRLSMGSSIGKRTHSELSDSDEDGEALDANDVGSSARRMRRKLHRTSLLFHDPPPARIEELEEPDSSEEDVLVISHDLARELPYWHMDFMGIESSSSI